MRSDTTGKNVDHAVGCNGNGLGVTGPGKQ
jgi:hypothetical protein